MATAPDDFHANVTLNNRVSVDVQICYSGDVARTEQLLRPWRSVAKTHTDTIRRAAYGELLRMPTDGTPDSISFTAITGLYLPNLSDHLFETIVDQINSGPDQTMVAFGHYMHGAVCKVPADETAFELRQPNAVHLFVSASWQNVDSSNSYMTWIDQMGDLLRGATLTDESMLISSQLKARIRG